MTNTMTKKQYEDMMVALFMEHPEYLENEEVFDKITDEYVALYGSHDDKEKATFNYPAYVCLAQQGIGTHQTLPSDEFFFCRNRL